MDTLETNANCPPKTNAPVAANAAFAAFPRGSIRLYSGSMERLDATLTNKPATAYRFIPKRPASLSTIPPQWARSSPQATVDPQTTTVHFKAMVSASKTSVSGTIDHSGTNTPATTMQKSTMPAARTNSPSPERTRIQARGANRSARQRIAQRSSTGHRLASSEGTGNPASSPPTARAAGMATIPQRMPRIKPPTSWLSKLPREVGRTKLMRQPSREESIAPE